MQKDVVGFEHGVGFELAAPVAVRMLQREEVVPRLADAGFDIGNIGVDAAKTRSSRLRLRLLYTHAV